MWEQIQSNQQKSAILITGMAVFLLLVGYALGEVSGSGYGLWGTGFAFIVWLIMTIVSFYKGDSIFLSMSQAKKIQPADHLMLYNIVDEMRIAAGLSAVPEIYIIDSDAPNAFAVGRNPEKASVAVTTGLLNILSRDELQGVIAHEIAHINNRDTLYMTLAGVMMGTIIMLADAGPRMLRGGGVRTRSSGKGGGSGIIVLVALILIIVAPIVARILYFSISRKREYLADACSAQYTRYPAGLASALNKLASVNLPLPQATKATAPMYIINPLKTENKENKKEKSNSFSDLFATHPPIFERVQILSNMCNSGYASYNQAYCSVTGNGESVISASGLVGAQDIPIREATSVDPIPEADKVREITDLVWKLNDYIFICCGCGTSMKIPPAYADKYITCPHCMKDHLAKAE